MAVIVAEYLGVRTDKGFSIPILPISKNSNNPKKPTLQCPFKSSHCDKAKRGDKAVCSIRDTSTGELWIVCENRLCATHKGSAKSPISLNEHQKIILHNVAKEIFEPVWRLNPKMKSGFNPDCPVVLEMQGGGETIGTGGY